MRIRQIAIPTGIAVVLMTAVSSPVYAASTPVKHHSAHHKADRSAAARASKHATRAADDSTGSTDSAGSTGNPDSTDDGDTARNSAFGTVTSFDPSTGALVVATSAGGTVSVSITDRTRLRLAAAKPAAPAGVHPAGRGGHGSDETAGSDSSDSSDRSDGSDDGDSPATARPTRAEHRAAVLAALVAGAAVKRLGLDPRTGDLRELVIG